MANKSVQSNLPLYTHIVAKYFYHSSVPDELPCLQQLFNAQNQLTMILKYISSSKVIDAVNKSAELSVKKDKLKEPLVSQKDVLKPRQHEKPTKSDLEMHRHVDSKFSELKTKFVARATSIATSVTSFGIFNFFLF